MTVQDLRPIIAAHPFFSDLEPELLSLIVGCAKNVRFRAGEYIFREAEPANEFFLLRSGRVAVEVSFPARAVQLQTLEAGDLLGWSWLFPPYKWTFDARVVEATRALAFDGTCLRDKCEQEPRAGYDLMKRFARVMADRLHNARIQILDVYGRDDAR